MLTLPNLAAGVLVVAGTDLIATLPRRIAHALAPPGALRFLKPPVPIGTIEVNLVWHHQHTDDAAHRWLRGSIAAVAQKL
jgi:DNA-binding transcriptional LysR family regulator